MISWLSRNRSLAEKSNIYIQRARNIYTFTSPLISSRYYVCSMTLSVHRKSDFASHESNMRSTAAAVAATASRTAMPPTPPLCLETKYSPWLAKSIHDKYTSTHGSKCITKEYVVQAERIIPKAVASHQLTRHKTRRQRRTSPDLTSVNTTNSL